MDLGGLLVPSGLFAGIIKTFSQYRHILTSAGTTIFLECVALSAGTLERSRHADANVLTVMITCCAQVGHCAAMGVTHIHTGR